MLCEGGTILSYTPHKHKSVVFLTTTDRRAVDAADAVDHDDRVRGRTTLACHVAQALLEAHTVQQCIPVTTTELEAHQTYFTDPTI